MVFWLILKIDLMMILNLHEDRILLKQEKALKL